MSSPHEHRRAFYALADFLRQSIQTTAQAVHAHRGRASGEALEKHLDHTLERYAGLYGLGTFENLTVSEIFVSAINGEARIAEEYRHEMEQQPERRAELAAAAERHDRRARELIDAARRGNRLHVPSGPHGIEAYRGVYVAPFSAKVQALLIRDREPFVRWQDGAVAAVPESLIAKLRGTGAEVTVLFRDADELTDEAGQHTPEEMEAELSRRVATA